MKEQVTDIPKVLLNIAEEMRLMRETINQQHTEITKLNRNIESLNHQLRKKNEEIAKLKNRLSKYETPDKNSGNSSTPPGKECMKDEIVRRTKTLRKPSGKKPGGQEGHKGHKLSCVDTPDEVIDDVPDYCTNCGESLADDPKGLHSGVEACCQRDTPLCYGMQELWRTHSYSSKASFKRCGV